MNVYLKYFNTLKQADVTQPVKTNQILNTYLSFNNLKYF